MTTLTGVRVKQGYFVEVQSNVETSQTETAEGVRPLVLEEVSH